MKHTNSSARKSCLLNRALKMTQSLVLGRGPRETAAHNNTDDSWERHLPLVLRAGLPWICVFLQNGKKPALWRTAPISSSSRKSSENWFIRPMKQEIHFSGLGRWLSQQRSGFISLRILVWSLESIIKVGMVAYGCKFQRWLGVGRRQENLWNSMGQLVYSYTEVVGW